MNKDKYQETFETWNNIADLYEEKFMQVDLYDESYDCICTSIIKLNAKILDLGCGPGNITKYLLTKRPDFDIFGIDIAPKMIDLAKRNNPTANFAVMDSRQIFMLNTKFDAIINGFCLPYFSENEAINFIDHANELLNKNGLLYISFVEGKPEDSDYKVGNGGRVYFNFHILDELKNQLSISNFEVLKLFKIAFPRSEKESEIHTVMVAKKLS